MKFYLTIIKDITKAQQYLNQVESAIMLADKPKFINSINQLEQKIKKIKDMCNEDTDI